MPELPTEIDTSRPHPARTYDYFLGGKDNFAADREVAEKVIAGWPAIRVGVRENRKFLARVVRYLAGEVGIRQFLDIGTGLPTANNTHEVAQEVAPSARVVYVDNDPLVLAHARALLASSPEGRTAYIHADLRDPVSILNDPVTRDVLDFTQPIALMLVAILSIRGRRLLAWLPHSAKAQVRRCSAGAETSVSPMTSGSRTRKRARCACQRRVLPARKKT